MKFKHLILVAFVAILSSCKTDEGINVTSADLIGTWDVTALTIDLATTTSLQNLSITSTTTGYGKDFDFNYTFSENPNTVFAVGAYTSVTTTSITGQQDLNQELRVYSIDGFDEGIWSLDGNFITITDANNQPSKAEIVSFSTNKLVMKVTTDESQNLNGASISIKGEIILTLEK